ncbi:MAG: hypothetical protein CL678_11870 [Bdellovibrionaceae bacterium]|nr:hypothetical protein [Pseudobdellovibrionaceae bacterium]|tara:strand:- start:74 stop:508 length:435 start_codon:yes stop_codon:yes gene_type:complete
MIDCNCEVPVGIAMICITIIIFMFYGINAGTIAWLALSTAHKLLWDIPVLQDKISIKSLNNFTDLLYTRQFYVNFELGFLAVFRRCTLDPPEFIKAVTTFYFIAGVAISTNISLKKTSFYYDIHDALGVLLVSIWVFHATKIKQ